MQPPLVLPMTYRFADDAVRVDCRDGGVWLAFLLTRGCRGSAELELVALGTERLELPVVTEVHRPSVRPPDGEAVTLRTLQRVAGDGPRPRDLPSKPFGASARLRPAVLVVAQAAGIHSGPLRRVG